MLSEIARADEFAEPGRRLLVWFRPFGEAAVVGLLIGLGEIHYTGGGPWFGTAYFWAGVVFGCRHAGRAWPCWPPLGVSLYAVHVAAIARGWQPPYVESSFQEARATLGIFYPVGLGVVLGAAIRFGLAVAGKFPRPEGPPVRLLPRTTLGTLVAVAEISITLGLLRWLIFHSETVYSARFDEGRFYQVSVGMASEQVEALLGPPIQKAKWAEDGTENWIYSQGANPISNYWRRWIFMKDAKVEVVIDDFWWD